MVNEGRRKKGRYKGYEVRQKWGEGGRERLAEMEGDRRKGMWSGLGEAV